MSFLEWMGVIFIAQIVVFLAAVVLVYLLGGVEQLNEEQSDLELDKIRLAAAMRAAK
jgi:FlaG/FlaF family flagellin (archaellin)